MLLNYDISTDHFKGLSNTKNPFVSTLLFYSHFQNLKVQFFEGLVWQMLSGTITFIVPDIFI